MRLVASALVASALLGALAGPAVADVRVAVQACPTTYGVPGDHPTRATHATLPLTANEASSLVAWAGGGTPIVLAPHGYACKALVGADGGVHVRLAPPDAGTSGPAVDVEVEGSCVGCIAAVACGLFPHAVKDTGFACHTPHPKGERVARLLPNVRAFIDPAGVRGSGNPSGWATARRRGGRVRPRPDIVRRQAHLHARHERRRMLPEHPDRLPRARRRALTA